MKKTTTHILYGIIASVAVFSIGLILIDRISNINFERQKAQALIQENQKEEMVIPEIKNTTLVFVGDMMLTRGVEASVNKNFNGDFNKLFLNIDEAKEADILFGNLEGPVSLLGNNVGSKYSFRMKPDALTAIKEASFDIVSFANNHVGDWNMTAFKDTLKRLDEIGIAKTGAGMNTKEVETPTIIEKNGIKFGFLGLSDVGPAWMVAKENTPGILLANNPKLSEIINNAKINCDVLIISIHFGDEYKKVHNVRQEKLAKLAIDSGADMVIGHHPHVIEDISEYKGKPIVYSLGNFIFDQSWSKDTMKGMMFKVTYEGKEIKSTESKTITLGKTFQPEGIYNKEELREKDEAISTVCPKPTKDYDDMAELGIDQDTSLPDKTYIPEKLRELNSESSTRVGLCLIKEARDQFEALVSKAKETGNNIKASSAFRSYNYQKILLDDAIKNGNKDANTLIAKPGYSEHQLGTAVDVTSKSINYVGSSNKLVTKFIETPEAKWMKENASSFGFIESYPSGKESITGYMYEPWHYRYVGVENAKEIIKTGKTINQFFEEKYE